MDINKLMNHIVFFILDKLPYVFIAGFVACALWAVYIVIANSITGRKIK